MSHWKLSGKIPKPFIDSLILLYRIAYIVCGGREYNTATLFISWPAQAVGYFKPLCPENFHLTFVPMIYSMNHSSRYLKPLWPGVATMVAVTLLSTKVMPFGGIREGKHNQRYCECNTLQLPHQ